MMKSPKFSWHVLLNDENWDESDGSPAIYGGLSLVSPEVRSQRKRVLQAIGLLSALLLLFGYAYWGAAEAVHHSVVGPTISHPPPISADALAATAHRVFLTEHLRFGASGTDIGVVSANLDEMEETYMGIFAMLGVLLSHGNAAPDGKLSVSVRGTGVPRWDRAKGRVILPSPAEMPLNSAMEQGEFLRQAWVLALIDQSILEAREVHQIPANWLSLLGGVRIWSLRKAGGPLADGWGDVIDRLYGEDGGHLSPAEVAAICGIYVAWEIDPVYFSIPLGCSPPGRVPPHIHAADLRLAGLGSPANDENGASAMPTTARRLALALLIEYAEDRFGQNRLPVLLAALVDHDIWDTLLPSVYGISAQEFELGWQVWMTRR